MRDLGPEQTHNTARRSVGRDMAADFESTHSARLPATNATRLRPGDVRSLQRLAGNAAVAQMLQHDDDSGDSDDSPGASVQSLLENSSGRPLDAATQAQMEPAFGRTFESVRLHEGAEAESSARQIGAQAYTVGRDIVLGQGHPDLSSAEGRRVIAHELTHVVQQERGPVDGTPVDGGIAVSHPSDRFEQEAEHQADAVMAGARSGAPQSARTSQTAGAATGATTTSVQRETEEETSESESTEHHGTASAATESESEESESTE